MSIWVNENAKAPGGSVTAKEMKRAHSSHPVAAQEPCALSTSPASTNGSRAQTHDAVSSASMTS